MRLGRPVKASTASATDATAGSPKPFREPGPDAEWRIRSHLERAVLGVTKAETEDSRRWHFRAA